VLIDAVGIEVPGHPVADFFAMTMTPAHPGEDDAGTTKDRRIRGRTRDA
jgi:hypothetical protein